MKDDKTKIKNWIEGDTFAVKIENHSKEYNGRYLIMIVCSYEMKQKKNIYFRTKMTNDSKIPSTIEEINSLDYIKTNVSTYESRLLPIDYEKSLYQILKEDSKKKYFPDEFGYLNEYRACFYVNNHSKYDEFIYIGNYNVLAPIDEYMSQSHWYYFFKGEASNESCYFVNLLLSNYDNYNLRKSPIYIKEKCELLHQRDRKMVSSILNYFNYCKNSKEKLYKGKFINGWGVDIYDSDVAIDIKSDYEKVYLETKDNKNASSKIISKLCELYEDYINDSIDGQVFWIIIADQEMKRKRLNPELKNIAYKSIEKDLKNWENNELYDERKKVLDKFRNKLDNFKETN